MHLSAQPAGAMFFRPSVAVETRGLRAYGLQAKARSGRALSGLGEGGAFDWIGGAATAVAGSIASIVGNTSPEATAQAQANAAAQIAMANAQREASLAAAENTKTMVLVGGGVVAAAIAAYVFTR